MQSGKGETQMNNEERREVQIRAGVGYDTKENGEGNQDA